MPTTPQASEVNAEGGQEPRPKTLTPEMKLRAARKVTEGLAETGKIDSAEIESHAADIAKHGRLHIDGYELAKDLESYCHWSCNLQMAEDLDSFSDYARIEIDNAERLWADRTNPQPPFPVTTRIRVGPTETGVITEIYDHAPAKYLVAIDGDPDANPPHHSRRIINFEDAVPLTATEPV